MLGETCLIFAFLRNCYNQYFSGAQFSRIMSLYILKHVPNYSTSNDKTNERPRSGEMERLKLNIITIEGIENLHTKERK